MLRILKVVPIVATIALLAGLAGNANAQALFPRTYGFSCTGKGGGGASLSLVGDMRFSDWTTATGGAEFVNGSIIQFASFTASVTNGTGNAQGVGGNNIPSGCFTGTAIFSGDTFGVLNSFFGCYNTSTHGFDLTQTSSALGAGAVLTCEGRQM